MREVTFTFDETKSPTIVQIEGWKTIQDLFVIENAITPTIEKYLSELPKDKLQALSKHLYD